MIRVLPGWSEIGRVELAPLPEGKGGNGHTLVEQDIIAVFYPRDGNSAATFRRHVILAVQWMCSMFCSTADFEPGKEGEYDRYYVIGSEDPWWVRLTNVGFYLEDIQALHEVIKLLAKRWRWQVEQGEDPVRLTPDR